MTDLWFGYACNSLTNFEYKAYAITGNGNNKKPPKMRLKKFGKWTGNIYPCHSLTNFQYYEAQAVTENEYRIY